MPYTVFFADKSVCFSDCADTRSADAVLTHECDRTLSRSELLTLFETHRVVLVRTSDPRRAFEAFAGQFRQVVAAGGVVVDERGEWLLIHRNGRWDLPKGHLEPCEDLPQCALREVGEETGVVGGRIIRSLGSTLHAYLLGGVWEMKRTHWYEIRLAGCAQTVPQHEEGIDRAEWCPPQEIARRLASSYPTIRLVAQRMMNPAAGTEQQ